jgi:hypothetical protein
MQFEKTPPNNRQTLPRCHDRIRSQARGPPYENVRHGSTLDTPLNPLRPKIGASC